MSRTATTKFLRGFATDVRYGKHTQDRLRELLRHTAQPVAVVTAKRLSKSNSFHPYHGATLSSFTSIAMHPYPLISFALRIPSRMANILKDALPEDPSHMVVNLLSAAQADVAVKFSRADIYPEPFASVPYTLSEEGHPILEKSLGSLSCKLVSRPLPLHDLDYLEGRGWSEQHVLDPGGAMASELFIARVLRVETLDTREEDTEDPWTLPLLYHRRGYTSCHLATSPKTK